MTPTPVGMRCPECARERTKVRTLSSGASGLPSVTQTLILINVAAFIAEVASGAQFGGGGGGSVYNHGVLFGPALTANNFPAPFPFSGTHQYWRLLTAGFLHAGLIHILFNMIFLYFMGPMLEPAIGRLNFAAVYIGALLAGSFGALLLTPDAPTVGASGAIFGVFGALLVVARDRGIPIWQSGLGLTLVINLVFTVSVSNVSIGGHLGGLVAGLICGYAIVELGEKRRQKWAPVLVCAAVAVVSVIGAIAVAGQHGLAPNGLHF
jgi:membrane associated rhomboid family serine protease